GGCVGIPRSRFPAAPRAKEKKNQRDQDTGNDAAGLADDISGQDCGEKPPDQEQLKEQRPSDEQTEEGASEIRRYFHWAVPTDRPWFYERCCEPVMARRRCPIASAMVINSAASGAGRWASQWRRQRPSHA